MFTTWVHWKSLRSGGSSADLRFSRQIMSFTPAVGFILSGAVRVHTYLLQTNQDKHVSYIDWTVLEAVILHQKPIMRTHMSKSNCGVWQQVMHHVTAPLVYINGFTQSSGRMISIISIIRQQKLRPTSLSSLSVTVWAAPEFDWQLSHQSKWTKLHREMHQSLLQLNETGVVWKHPTISWLSVNIVGQASTCFYTTTLPIMQIASIFC